MTCTGSSRSARVITTYTLASGLIAAGMSWWQGLLTVSLGNFIVLIDPSGHPFCVCR